MKRRRVLLADLPEFGLLWSLSTGRRGVITTWRYKRGVLWAAQVYFLGNEFGGRGKKWVQPQTWVEVDERDDTINTAHKRGDTGDAFIYRWEFKDTEAREYAAPAALHKPSRGSHLESFLESFGSL